MSDENDQTGAPAGDGPTPAGMASLAATVLDEEAARHAEQESSEVLFADDLLPGVKSEGLSLKKGLAMGGGAATFVVLALLNSLDELQHAAIRIHL